MTIITQNWFSNSVFMVRISTCMRMDVISMSMKNWFLMVVVMMVVAGMRVHHVAMMVHIIFRTFRTFRMD